MAVYVAIWGRLGSLLGCIGGLVKPFWVPFGTFGGRLGGVLGPFWMPHWAILAVLEATLDRLGALLKPSWGPLGLSLNHLGNRLGRLRLSEPEIARMPKSLNNAMHINEFGLPEVLLEQLGVSQGPFRAS